MLYSTNHFREQQFLLQFTFIKIVYADFSKKSFKLRSFLNSIYPFFIGHCRRILLHKRCRIQDLYLFCSPFRNHPVYEQSFDSNLAMSAETITIFVSQPTTFHKTFFLNYIYRHSNIVINNGKIIFFLLFCNVQRVSPNKYY